MRNLKNKNKKIEFKAEDIIDITNDKEILPEDKKIPRLGRPPLDSYKAPEDLPDRIKEWCQLCASGIPPDTAGIMLKPQASLRQIEIWCKNAVIKECIAQYIIEDPQEMRQKENETIKRQRYHIYLEACKEAIRRLREGKVNWKDIHHLIEKYEAMTGIIQPTLTKTTEIIQEKTMMDLIRELPQEEQKKLMLPSIPIKAKITKEKKIIKTKQEKNNNG